MTSAKASEPDGESELPSYDPLQSAFHRTFRNELKNNAMIRRDVYPQCQSPTD